jgi:leader peptidase (prepilin peptidase) / N-methyltransferase
MELVVVALLGLIIGSFLNVVIWRLPRGESLRTPNSRCPSCEARIRPRDNMPVVSWLLLRGRCRSCGAPISPRYPLVEALTGVIFLGVALARGVEDDLAVWLPFAAVLIAVAGIDLDPRIIPNKIVVPAAVYGLLATIVLRPDNIDDALIAGAAAFLALFLAAVAYPAGMGMGDVKLAGVMGIYLGSSVAPAMLVAFLSGSVVGIAILAREGRSARKKGVPFGPFLALGGLVGILVGPELVDIYVDNFLNG